jgi:D-Tyr-tRNAtyr deacylase
MLSFGPLAVRFGRKLTFVFYHAAALVVVPLTCFAPTSYSMLLALLPFYGFVTIGIHAGYAIYFPELFPNHLRSTGTGFCFNGGRFLALVHADFLRLVEGAAGHGPASCHQFDGRDFPSRHRRDCLSSGNQRGAIAVARHSNVENIELTADLDIECRATPCAPSFSGLAPHLVTVEGEVVGAIGRGLLVLVGGNESADTAEDIEWLAGRSPALRLFPALRRRRSLGAQRRRNRRRRSPRQPVHSAPRRRKARSRAGIRAAKAHIAQPLYEQLAQRLTELLGRPVKTGRFAP